jgi:protein SMG6
MEWVGRKVFERGYWKSGSTSEESRSEIDVLANRDHFETTDGKIEDDDGADAGHLSPMRVDGQCRQLQQKSIMSQGERRWVRVLRCGIGITEVVDGFSWINGTKIWKIEGKLVEKVRTWTELHKIAEQEEEERRMRRRWADESMDIDEDEMVESEESDDDENDSEEVKTLKVCLEV